MMLNRGFSYTNTCAVVLLTAMAMMSGCVIATTGKALPRSVPSANAPVWPVREMQVIQDLHERTPTKMSLFTVRDGVDAAMLTDADRARLAESPLVVSLNTLTPFGLLRSTSQERLVDDDVSVLQDLVAALTGFEANAQFLSSYSLARIEYYTTVYPERTTTAELYAHQHPNLLYADPDDELYLESGVDLRIPTSEEVVGARGIAIHLTALLGNEYETAAVDALRAGGWAVIDIDTPVWSTPIPELKTLTRDADTEAVGIRFAEAMDGVMAESAYAAEAALDHVRVRDGLSPKTPVIVVGFSAGAIAGPAVAARLLPHVDAVVLVGGGADLFTIVQRSTLHELGPKTVQVIDGSSRRELEKRIRATYLSHTTLDPYAVSPALAGVPVLQLHGVFDRIVPASTGKLLSQRLGHPDCCTFFVGHRLLFYLLPSQSDEIVSWVNRNTDYARSIAREPAELESAMIEHQGQ